MTPQAISPFFPKGETEKSYYGSKELLWHQVAPICIHRWPLWRRRKCTGIAIFYLLTKNVFLFAKYFTGLSCSSVSFLLKLTPSQYSSVNSSVRRWYQEALAECRAERPGREESRYKTMIKPVSTVSTWGLFHGISQWNLCNSGSRQSPNHLSIYMWICVYTCIYSYRMHMYEYSICPLETWESPGLATVNP